MRSALQIALKDLKLRTRDRSFFIIGIVAPLVLAFIFNLVFGGVFSGDSIISLAYANEDEGVSREGFDRVIEAIGADGAIDMTVVDTEAALRALVEEGTVGAGLVVPAGFSTAAIGGRKAEITVVGEVDSPTSAEVANGIAVSLATSLTDGSKAASIAADLGVTDPEVFGRVAADAGSAAPVVDVVATEAGESGTPSAATTFAVSMAVFFVFFTIQFGVTGLLDEEREGTLVRLKAAPISRFAPIVGKAVTSVLLGVFSLIVLWLASSLLMDARWGNPIGVVLLIVSVCLAATAILGVVAGIARTPEAAGNVSSVIAVALAMLGGVFLPLTGTGSFIQSLSRLTPHVWFIEGINDLAGGAPLSSVATPVAALLAFGIGVGLVAAFLMRRRFA